MFLVCGRVTSKKILTRAVRRKQSYVFFWPYLGRRRCLITNLRCIDPFFSFKRTLKFLRSFPSLMFDEPFQFVDDFRDRFLITASPRRCGRPRTPNVLTSTVHITAWTFCSPKKSFLCRGCIFER